MVPLKQNDKIILQNQKSGQSNIMDSKNNKNNSSCSIFQVANWNQKAAEGGVKVAQYNLALSYRSGEGTDLITTSQDDNEMLNSNETLSDVHEGTSSSRQIESFSSKECAVSLKKEAVRATRSIQSFNRNIS